MEKAEPSRTRRRLDSPEPARTSRLPLFLSVSLNLGLLLFLAWVGGSSSPEVSPTNPSPDNTAQADEHILKAHAKRIAHSSPWRQLESTNLTLYAANLRAGCPSQTVRDILLPGLEEKFEHPESPIPEPTNFWASFSQRQAAAAARAEQESAIEQQKNKMLEEVLGFVWTSEGLRQAYAGEAASALGFLDYERAEKFLCIAQRFKKQFEGVDRLHRIDLRSAIYQARRQDVSEVLSPAECDENELREILMLFQRRDPNLCKVGLSASELRQLMAFRRELCNPLPSTFLASGDEPLQEPDWASEQQFDAKVRALLGDNRFLDYLKNCDASIERTLATLEKEQLPRSLALQLFDLREEAMARGQEIRRMPVRLSQKRVSLTALRQSALEQLAALPNAAIDINQDWLQEITNP